MDAGHDEIRGVVKEVLRDELRGLLDDVSWRMQSVAELAHGKVPAELLNLKTPLLTGYTVESNSPTGGSIEWTDVNIVYMGEVHGPFAGDTADKYVWFELGAGTISSGNSKPVLDEGDALIFVNDGGEVTEAVNSRGQIHGGQAKDATIGSSEMADAAVTAAKILDGAVGDVKIADLDGSKLLGGTVGNTQLGSDLEGSKFAEGSIGAERMNTLQHLLF